MSVSTQQYYTSFNKVVDKLFVDIAKTVDPNLDYFQAKIDLVVEKFTNDVGTSLYKLYICQALIRFMQHEFLEAIQMVERSDEVRAGGQIHREYEKVKSYIAAESHVILGRAQSAIDDRQETKAIGVSALHAALYSGGLILLGLIVTGISYSATTPGQTYTVTTGLFLVGAGYGCAAIYRLLRWVGRKCN